MKRLEISTMEVKSPYRGSENLYRGQRKSLRGQSLPDKARTFGGQGLTASPVVDGSVGALV